MARLTLFALCAFVAVCAIVTDARMLIYEESGETLLRHIDALTFGEPDNMRESLARHIDENVARPRPKREYLLLFLGPCTQMCTWAK